MAQDWPELPLAQWQDTCATLHMWTQIVGKIKLKLTPLVNHWWNTSFRLSPRGFDCGTMCSNSVAFAMEFDFQDHQLNILCEDGRRASIALAPKSVARFYRETLQTLHDLGIDVRIWPVPVEVPEPIPFKQDERHSSYDPEFARRHWQVLLQSANVFEEFRSRYLGKCSPVHFFWGSFDLAVTRFNGLPAPEREGADSITREAYSHAVISHGFWAGGNGLDASYYAYAAPEPAGLAEAVVQPSGVSRTDEMGLFVLPYDVVRQAEDPVATLLEFMQSTYEVAATLAGWDRAALERAATATAQRN